MTKGPSPTLVEDGAILSTFLVTSTMSVFFFKGVALFTPLVLFVMGAMGTFLNRRNLIIMLLCIELMLLAANLVFLTASVALDDINGQLLALWVMTAAAAETALGLALCVLHYRLRATLDVELINLMKGSQQNHAS